MGRAGETAMAGGRGGRTSAQTSGWGRPARGGGTGGDEAPTRPPSGPPHAARNKPKMKHRTGRRSHLYAR
eukprot:scaffold1340_cov109-Isochrysis_galbana.AAC.3